MSTNCSNAGRRLWCQTHHLPVFAIASLLILLPSLGYADQTPIQNSVQLLEQGNLAAAESQARMAIADTSSRAVAYAILGAIRLRQTRYDESVRFLETALRLDPRLTGARLNLGDVYVLQGKSNQAEIVFHQVLKLDPDNFNARFTLARLENEAGRYAASMELAKPVIGELPMKVLS
jgi:cytochrome c-type biogenesis protein CcmH/NrfG